MHKLSLLVVIGLLVACSKKAKTAASCGPLTVTVGGTALAAMPNGVARLNVMSGSDRSYEVQVFNHADTTCEKFLDRKGRQIPDGEVSVRAFAGGGGLMGKGVGIESHTQAGGDVELVGPAPKAAGDTVSICISEVSFTPRVGAAKGKQVVMNGLIRGAYCGEMKF